ncbi:MAG: hypothetical protein ACKOWG_13505, partial [Planctomycetia bacterium]
EDHPDWLQRLVASERPNQETVVKVDEVVSHRPYFGEQSLGGILAALKPNCWPDNRDWIPDKQVGIPSKTGRIDCCGSRD